MNGFQRVTLLYVVTNLNTDRTLITNHVQHILTKNRVYFRTEVNKEFCVVFYKKPHTVQVGLVCNSFDCYSGVTGLNFRAGHLLS
jgi:hypothetical protein